MATETKSDMRSYLGLQDAQAREVAEELLNRVLAMPPDASIRARTLTRSSLSASIGLFLTAHVMQQAFDNTVESFLTCMARRGVIASFEAREGHGGLTRSWVIEPATEPTRGAAQAGKDLEGGCGEAPFLEALNKADEGRTGDEQDDSE